MKNTRLSKHFMLAEFLNQGKYPLRPATRRLNARNPAG